MMTHEYHETNRKRWDAGAEQWARSADARDLWPRCHTEPGLVLHEKELAHLTDVAGKQVCVLGSGDSQNVFALAGMGAHVTSVDFSANQLKVARTRAKTLGLEITFLRADVTDLSALESDTFDLVYTGGHVAVWVSDLETYYAEAVRILKPGAIFMVSEYHPFRRIWKPSKDELVVGPDYFVRGPFEYGLNDNILRPEPGELKSYEFHWTVGDYLNAVINAGCRVVEVAEYGRDAEDWEGAPVAGLPECLLIVARKETEDNPE
ncbi:MAG TPA: class I SAM-dependent methyltransferase [Planctomycetota bacterium]|nr:class I SAM-dependent methyltransferase [Planctomycetota bacterium]